MPPQRKTFSRRFAGPFRNQKRLEGAKIVAIIQESPDRVHIYDTLALGYLKHVLNQAKNRENPSGETSIFDSIMQFEQTSPEGEAYQALGAIKNPRDPKLVKNKKFWGDAFPKAFKEEVKRQKDAIDTHLAKNGTIEPLDPKPGAYGITAEDFGADHPYVNKFPDHFAASAKKCPYTTSIKICPYTDFYVRGPLRKSRKLSCTCKDPQKCEI